MRVLRMLMAAGALAGTVALTGGSAVAVAGGTGVYTVVLSPSATAGGASTSFAATITDSKASATRLGAVNLTAPSGFQLVSASLPAGSPGSASVSGNVVRLRNLALKPGAGVSASVSAIAACAAGSDAWSSAATSEGNFTGTQLSLGAGESRLSTTVSSSCSLQFTAQPADTQVSQVISATAFDPSGPPLQVQILDGNGHASASNAPVSLSLASNPGAGTLGGTTTRSAVGGVASFDDLTIDQAGNGYRLQASSLGAASAVSSAFNEVTAGTTCPPGQSCQTGADTSTSSFDILSPPSGSPNTLSVSVDIGTPLRCGDYVSQDSNWFAFQSSSTSVGKTITYTVQPSSATGNPLAATQFCLGAPYQFLTSAGGPAAAGTLPDGSSGFLGLLPTCAMASGGPCLDTKTTTPDSGSPTGYDVVLKALFPAGLPGDPWGKA